MTVDTQADVYAEITTVAPDPKGTARLARAYHRDVLRRLAPHVTAPERVPATGPHPRTVWAAGELRAGRPVDEACLADIRASLAPDGPGLPPLEHVTGVPGYPLWCRAALTDLREDMLRTAGVGTPEMTATAASEAVARVDEAAGVLRRVWPEAAVELGLLVRAVVYVGGGAFRSATLQRNYGAVFAGVDHLRTVPAAFEMLLHETGHHSLYLRNAFGSFVDNGDDLVSHALRPDPRPVSGTLHAAHVLARMAAGLHRWSSDPGAPEEVVRRRDDALERLRATTAVLRTAARWTGAGAEYFLNLLAWQRQLTETCVSDR
ncbi:HEXXH motif-containing putative peptide modification protein [Streptomyces sp. S.PNR 29]|uniref:aKG-HExxH-type peptide beta-hydroxylase n=1 Tax=Streptomyces sp. S.PNR 29 TaxID=2973805 RepID=UPI0025B275BE|nr:HEXXH motif-containing putative peptide modification protein [Streptomyces sp. S.PNR 29]MDN0194143.1 HEXXH motif-containing putative peptide modification protein [Streptomyces sp. S.PNR 29]